MELKARDELVEGAEGLILEVLKMKIRMAGFYSGWLVRIEVYSLCCGYAADKWMSR